MRQLRTYEIAHWRHLQGKTEKDGSSLEGAVRKTFRSGAEDIFNPDREFLKRQVVVTSTASTRDQQALIMGDARWIAAGWMTCWLKVAV
jgi:hypothetical protein